MSEFKLVQSFDCDDDGPAFAEAFCLGFEFSGIWNLAKQPAPFSERIRVKNVKRVSQMLANQGRRFTVEPDVEGHARVAVEGLS